MLVCVDGFCIDERQSDMYSPGPGHRRCLGPKPEQVVVQSYVRLVTTEILTSVTARK